MLKYLSIAVLSLAWHGAVAQDAASAVKESPAAAPAAAEPAVAIKVVESDASAKDEEAFTPPPGFSTKKHGKYTVYCKKDASIGTRFRSEKCFDREQLQEYLLTQEENKRDVDRMRATCGGGSTCVHQ